MADLCLTAIWIEEQPAVARVHHTDAETHESDRAIAKIVAFPSAFGNVGLAKQCARNFAVGRIIKPSVERAHREDQPVFSRLWQCGRIGTRAAAG